MFELLFTTNKKPAHKLKEEYGFNEYDTAYIRDHFRPILVENGIEPEEIGSRLKQYKNKFIEDYGQFDLHLFQKQNDLIYCHFELDRIKKTLSNGHIRVWDFRKNHYFHKLDVEGDTPNAQTLIISKKMKSDWNY